MSDKTKIYVYVGMYAALAVVLNYATKLLPSMPNGGTVELPVIALFLASFHLGWRYGLATGLLSWLVGFLLGLNNYFVSPMQVVLDYIVPVMAPGMAAVFPSLHIGKSRISNVSVGIVVGMFIKYAAHVLSGVYFWFPEGTAAGSLAAWIYSGWTYNLAYNAATLVVAFIVVPILLRVLRRSSRMTFIGIRK